MQIEIRTQIYINGAWHAGTAEQAVYSLANDGEYALAATVVGDNQDDLRCLVKEIRAGFVTVNAPRLVMPQLLGGGFKKSSLGRALGLAGMRAYQEVKAIARATGASPSIQTASSTTKVPYAA